MREDKKLPNHVIHRLGFLEKVHLIACSVCGERISLEDAREMFTGKVPNTVKYTCGKPLSRELLQVRKKWEEYTDE